MFGYVEAYKPQMKYCEFDVYQGVYCSLCRTLGKRYSSAARMTLSYDFTFLALFIMALSDEPLSFYQGRCALHPTKKRLFCRAEGTKALDYAADVAMLLTYHKMSDAIADEHFVKSLTARASRLFISRDYKRAVKRRPKEALWARDYMEKQSRVEKADTVSVDMAAEPTAEFLSRLISRFATDERTAPLVSRFGYCLGRYIYLADAADDLKKDLESGSFNPYLQNEDRQALCGDAEAVEQIREYAMQSLYTCVAVCAECYDELPIKRFDGILYNVIYHGMPSVIRRIRRGKQEDRQDEKSV